MIDSLTILSYVLGATVLLLGALGMLFWWHRQERLDAAELERRRRLRVNRIGRLVEGHIIELRGEPAPDNPTDHLLVYNYAVRGVEYQAAQDISFLGAEASALDLRRLAAGQSAQVKYDPQNPTNSIILCEEWSGI